MGISENRWAAWAKLSWRNPIVLVFCFLLIVSIRFDRNDLVVKRPLNDAAFYIANVQFLKGEKLTYDFKGPFNERLLVTAVAATLPFTPLTAINLANIFFLLGALYFLNAFLRLLQLKDSQVWIGLYLFVFSFPTFYYSTIGYTDPGVLCMIFMGAYAIYADQYFLFLGAILLGALAKENIVIVIPVAIAYAYSRGNNRWYVTAGLGILLFLSVSVFIKNLFASYANEVFYWHFSFDRALFNLGRFNFYFSSIFSFGIPGGLCLLLLFTQKRSLLKLWKADLPLIIGVLVSFLPWLYMIPSAFPDGRAFWVGSCFPIGLAMVWLSRFKNPFKRNQPLWTDEAHATSIPL